MPHPTPARAASAPLLLQLGARVRAQRKAGGITVKALAEAAELSPRFINQLESGQGNISVARLASVCEALELELSTLFVGLGPGTTQRPQVISLLGLRGAGKSSIGGALALALECEHHELDRLIEDAAGLSLGEIFDLHGEAYYQRLQRDTLARFLSAESRGVLATGGSIVTDPIAWQMLRDRTRTIWLRAEPEDHWARVIAQGDRRPMADNPNAMSQLRALLEARTPLYAQAELTLDTHGRSVAEVSAEAARALQVPGS